MQIDNPTELLAWTLIIIGIIIIIYGIASMLWRSGTEAVEHKSESKGIILLGPIPIVWGYGKKTWIVAAIIAMTIFLLAIFWFP